MSRRTREKGARPLYVYGRHPVAEALRAQPKSVQRLYVATAGRSTRLSDIVGMAHRQERPVVEVARRVLDDLVGDVPHQGVVAALAPFRYSAVETLLARAAEVGEAPLLLALDQVQDPHNLGALCRSALALGTHGVLIPKDRSCEITPTVMKAAAGAVSHLAIARVTNLRRTLDELKDADLWIVGAAAEAGKPVHAVDLRPPTIIVVGSEGKGLRRLVAESCDSLVHIPMPGGLGSLNASVAGSILLYEAMRQRTHGAGPGKP